MTDRKKETKEIELVQRAGEPTHKFEIPDDTTSILEEIRTGPQDWFWPAVFSAVFCFAPTGIFAVLSARSANRSYVSGDLYAWRRYHRRARVLVFLTGILGILVYGVIIGVVHAIRHVDT